LSVFLARLAALPVLFSYTTLFRSLNLTDGGEVVSVRITECDGCMPRQFLPAPNLEIVLEGEQVTARQASSANGRAGTVLYDGQTELAQVVIFYGPRLRGMAMKKMKFERNIGLA